MKSSISILHPIFYLMLMIITLSVSVGAAESVPIYLSSDFWNFVYVIDAQVIDIKGSNLMVEVNRSWTDYAESGDILTFSVPTSYCIQREGIITKPPRLLFRIGDNYLLFSEQSILMGFGIEGTGFYQLKGCSGWGISPSIISIAELDSLAVHIGNDPGFGSRKWIAAIAFPSGERLTVQELNDICTSRGTDEKRLSPISFRFQNNSLHFDRPFNMPWSRTHLIRFFSVVDSVVGSRFYETFIPRGTVLSTLWVIKWTKGRDLVLTAPVMECISTGEHEISTPVSLEFNGFGMTLNLSEGSMIFNWTFPEIPYQEGPMTLIFYPPERWENYSSQLPRILLQFPEIEYEPGIPEAFTIETALCNEPEIPIYLFYADSLNSKFYPAFRFSISMDDSIRSSL